MQIKDQVAFVTGGASGLGLATVRAIVERGGKAVAFDLKGSDEIAALGDDVIFVEGDVTDEAQVQAAIARTSDLGDLRIVVNCAGIGGSHRVSGRKGVFPLDHFTKVVTVNLIGTFNVIRLGSGAHAGDRPGGRGARRRHQHRVRRLRSTARWARPRTPRPRAASWA